MTTMFVATVLSLLCIFDLSYSQKHSLNGTIYYNAALNLYNLTIDVVDCNKDSLWYI